MTKSQALYYSVTRALRAIHETPEFMDDQADYERGVITHKERNLFSREHTTVTSRLGRAITHNPAAFTPSPYKGMTTASYESTRTALRAWTSKNKVATDREVNAKLARLLA